MARKTRHLFSKRQGTRLPALSRPDMGRRQRRRGGFGPLLRQHLCWANKHSLSTARLFSRIDPPRRNALHHTTRPVANAATPTPTKNGRSFTGRPPHKRRTYKKTINTTARRFARLKMMSVIDNSASSKRLCISSPADRNIAQSVGSVAVG